MSVSYDQLQERLEKQRQRHLAYLYLRGTKLKRNSRNDDAESHQHSLEPGHLRLCSTVGHSMDNDDPHSLGRTTSERILEESLFWVQTRAVNCNYCMGHCEMLLEVAGLDQPAVAKRTRLLAETDWAAFPKSEQVAYAYARKLSATPAKLTSQDYESLEKEFGPKQAMSIFVWLCRGLYMTRISDGFQLPLERDNVFGGHAPAETKN